jgi:hypothetical protein
VSEKEGKTCPKRLNERFRIGIETKNNKRVWVFVWKNKKRSD